MTDTATVNLTFGISGITHMIDGIATSRDTMTTLAIPQRLSDEHLAKARRDAEILLDALQAQPQEIATLVNAVLGGNDPVARDNALKLGFTEETMQRDGGGYVWVVVAVIAVGAALLLASDSPSTEGSAGPSDAGTPNGG